MNTVEIYEKISGYEETVRMTIEAISECKAGSDVLDRVNGALNNIERLTPRYPRWHASTPAKSSRTTA